MINDFLVFFRGTIMAWPLRDSYTNTF